LDNQEPESEVGLAGVLPEASEGPPFASCCAAPPATTATPAATAATPDATRATRFKVPFAPRVTFFAVERIRDEDFPFLDAFFDAFLDAAGRRFAGAALADFLFFELLRAAMSVSPSLQQMQRH
jgi:hypothetical protein